MEDNTKLRHQTNPLNRMLTEKELFETMEDYIDLLKAELDEVVQIVHPYGWRSKRAEKGEELRSRINELKESL